MNNVVIISYSLIQMIKLETDWNLKWRLKCPPLSIPYPVLSKLCIM